MTWNPYLLPVRALGKCGGYDSDIIAGMQWAVGMTVMDGSGNRAGQPVSRRHHQFESRRHRQLSERVQSVISNLTTMGVLVVASAGNESGPVDAPGNCSGRLGGRGAAQRGHQGGLQQLRSGSGRRGAGRQLRDHIRTVLRSIDTTVNTGLTTPGSQRYTDQTNPNLGTSFSAPIVSGIAALMRAVNANLTPPQLIARIKASATAFPPNTRRTSPCARNLIRRRGECACVRRHNAAPAW